LVGEYFELGERVEIERERKKASKRELKKGGRRGEMNYFEASTSSLFTSML
jgi:hypothetical protein